MLSHMPDEKSRAEFVSYYPWHYELDIHQAGIESALELAAGELGAPSQLA